MKRGLRAALFLLLSAGLFFLLAFSSSAQEQTADGGEEALLRDLERQIEELIPGDIPSGIGDFGAEELVRSVGLGSLLSGIFEELSGRRGAILSFFFLLIGTAVLLAAAERFSPSGSLSPAISAGAAGVLCLPLFSGLTSALRGVIADIGGLTAFLSDAVPVMAAVQAAGGGIYTAAVQSAGVTLSVSLIGRLAEGLLLPLVSFLIALAPVSAVDAAGRVERLAARVRKCFSFLLGLASFLWIATLALQSAVASAKDGAALRAARYAAGMLPMVGGTISGSLGILGGGVGYLRSVLGVSAVAALISLFAAPLFELILYRLSLFAATVLLGFLGAGGGERALTGFCHALDALIAVFSFCSAVSVLEIVLFMKSGVTAA